MATQLGERRVKITRQKNPRKNPRGFFISIADYNVYYRSNQTNRKRHKTVRATSEARYGLVAISAIKKNKDARSIPDSSLLSRVRPPNALRLPQRSKGS